MDETDLKEIGSEGKTDFSRSMTGCKHRKEH